MSHRDLVTGIHRNGTTTTRASDALGGRRYRVGICCCIGNGETSIQTSTANRRAPTEGYRVTIAKRMPCMRHRDLVTGIHRN